VYQAGEEAEEGEEDVEDEAAAAPSLEEDAQGREEDGRDDGEALEELCVLHESGSAERTRGGERRGGAHRHPARDLTLVLALRRRRFLPVHVRPDRHAGRGRERAE